MPDVLACRDIALHKLALIASGPYPGGFESKHLKQCQDDQGACEIHPKRAAASRHSLVTTNRDNFGAIRTEVVSAATNFLSQRLCVEQERILRSMKSLLEADSAQLMISAGSTLVDDLFPGEITEFANAVCESWDAISELPQLPADTDRGCALSTRLRQMLPVSRGILQKLLAAMMALAPHSMQLERVISHYNKLRTADRLSMTPETVNDRLKVSLNGIGIASFDPRPCVAKFLSAERRAGAPDPETYCKRFYVKTFFRTDNML